MISLLVNETKEGAPSLEQRDRKMEEDRRERCPQGFYDLSRVSAERWNDTGFYT